MTQQDESKSKGGADDNGVPDYDPFRGARARGTTRDDRTAPFPEDRLTAAGADGDVLEQIREQYGSDPSFANFVRQADDDGLKAHLQGREVEGYDTDGKTADEVKQDVDRNPGLVRAALNAEQARGRKQRVRSGLVQHLQGVLAKQTARDNVTPAADPETADEIDPATVPAGGDYRTDPTRPAPTGGGDVPSGGPAPGTEGGQTTSGSTA
jgi:hypothetical protein